MTNSAPSPKAPYTPPSIEDLKKNVYRPKKALITGGMPYANGPVHLGHLAGALIPPDIFARFMRMLIGADKVLFVSGNDDHGSTSELAALKAGKPIREFIDEIHEQQLQTLKNYHLSFDVFSGTSRPECFPKHSALCQDFIRKLHHNGMLIKKTSLQWFDTQLERFLQDRFVVGTCPKCTHPAAYSDQCDQCGSQYDPSGLKDPRSTLSQSTPELRETVHWWLDLWSVSENLRLWIQSKAKTWRTSVYKEVLGTVLPSLAFPNSSESAYKEIKATLPKHNSKYAPGKKVQLQFENKADYQKACEALGQIQISFETVDGWAQRSISRDVSWGIPMPVDLDPDMAVKTFYVWPDSLIAPISFTQVALENSGKNAQDYKEFWCDPKAKIYQFLGQDNVYFYVLMQGAMWFGQLDNIKDSAQKTPEYLPQAGDYQLSEVFGSYHLWVNGEKMSKSTGNFFTGDQLLQEMGYSPDQIRYFLATLNLSDKNSNFDLKVLHEKSKFLAGPMNAAFEKPISACHSKYEGKVPQGSLNPKVQAETQKIIQKYLQAMPRSEHNVLLNLIENYARQINSLFTQFKPHDDRAPKQEREDALYSCFYVLKTLMIMLQPFVPETMNKLRETLNLPESVFAIEELGTPIPAGHNIGTQQSYFPATKD